MISYAPFTKNGIYHNVWCCSGKPEAACSDLYEVQMKQKGIKMLTTGCISPELQCRQLQRILNQYESEGIVVKTGKGAYKLAAGG